MSLSFVPQASVDRAPGIGWEILRSTGAPPSADRVVLFEGKLTSTELRAVIANKTTATLDARVVPIKVFPSGGATAVASEHALAEGDYTLVVTDSGWNHTFHVAPTEDPPVLARAWPPRDMPASASALVYCGAAALSTDQARATLQPANVSGAFAAPFSAGSRCIRFVADAPMTDGEIVPAPTVAFGDGTFRLEPGSLTLSAGTPTDVVKCHAPEHQLGPGCATVLDDRIKVRSPQAPVAWSIGVAGGDTTFTSTSGGSRFVIRGLHPLADFKVDVTTIDTTGTASTSTLAGVALAPMPHVIINETYAHPVGPRPDQQWVELYNDGPTGQSLYGFALSVANTATPLPNTWIPPGGYALVVNFAYQADDAVDLAPPTNCPLARVAKIGTKGLALTGQLLRLLGPDGSVLSAFPAIAQHTAGISAVRSAPDAPDDDSASFSLGNGPPTPCEPNAGM